MKKKEKRKENIYMYIYMRVPLPSSLAKVLWQGNCEFLVSLDASRDYFSFLYKLAYLEQFLFLRLLVAQLL